MRRFTLVLTCLLSTTFFATAMPADAVEPTVKISGTTTFTGKGFGHGRGLSQYGARGRALKNWHVQSILGFYYPGTTFANETRDIRIWLKGDIDSDTVVLPRTGLFITDSGRPGKTYTLPAIAAQAWRLTGSGTSSGFRVSYLKAGAWHSYLPGGHAMVGYGEFGSTGARVTVRMPGGDKTYRGRIQRRNSHTINRTSLDSYVRGVVGAEMPATWPIEALKSQSVAARTFGAYSRMTSSGPSDTWNVDDTTSYQVYRGVAAETDRTNHAVTETSQKILVYSGSPAYTQFSSSNGGWTVAGATKPYLQAKADTYEQYASNPYASWTYAPSQSTLQAKLKTLAASSKYKTNIGTPTGLQVVARDGHGWWGGRVTDIRLIGTAGSVVVDGSDLRFAIGLRSTYFTLTD